MLTALKTERSDTTEVFFHSYTVSLHSHRRFLVQAAEVFRRTVPGVAQTQPGRVTQFSFSISILHTTTVAIGNIPFWMNTWADLQNSVFSHWHLPFLNLHCINTATNRYTSLRLHCLNSISWQTDFMLLHMGKEVARETEQKRLWVHVVPPEKTPVPSFGCKPSAPTPSHAPDHFTHPQGGQGALCQPDQLFLHPHWPDPEVVVTLLKPPPRASACSSSAMKVKR